MVEPARRMGGVPGSDAVRRLMARPIRMRVDPGRDALRMESGAAADTPSAGPAPATEGERRPDPELMILKAVLRSEREENAKLRACLGIDAEPDGLGEEARALRERWAALVDRLLHDPR